MWSDCYLLRQPSAGVKARVTAFTFVVQLDFKTAYAALSSWMVVAP